MEALKNKIRTESTETILSCINSIGGGDYTTVSKEQRMVRAALIAVYAERTSDEAAELLMDTLGL